MDRIEWLSTKQVAARLGVVLRTLYRLIDGGHLPACRIGRVIRIKSSDIDAVIGSARVCPDLFGIFTPQAKSSCQEKLAVKTTLRAVSATHVSVRPRPDGGHPG